MTLTCYLLTLGVIFCAYLRSRAAVNTQRRGRFIPPLARSRFQPYLAVYGLAIFVVLSKLPLALSSTIVLFQGYQVLVRGTSAWSAQKIGSVVPWFVMVLICMLCIGWFLHNWRTWKTPTWRVTRLPKIDLITGVAPTLSAKPEPTDKGRFWSAISWILDNI